MITPMTRAYAVAICGWEYEAPYAVYNLHQNEDTLEELTNGDYYACLDPNDILLGFFCFGKSARISTAEPDAYKPGMLDIGLGMKPSLCGKGKGYAFMTAGLDFAKNKFSPTCFRLTVAVFNKRAIRLYERAGFRVSSKVTHKASKRPFQIMTRAT